MRAQDFLTDARRNPDQNPKISELEQLEDIAEQYGTENIYVRFVDLPKLGINPNSTYGTPFGICAYPLEYVIEKELDVPFAGEMPYMVVFEDTGANLLHLHKPSTEWTPDDLELGRRMVPILKSVLKTDKLDMKTEKHDPQDEDATEREWSPVWSWMYKNILQFSDYANRGKTAAKILKQLGYDGVQDPGYGIIFTDEPKQTIFFNTSNLRLIASIDRHISDTFIAYGKPNDWTNYHPKELTKADTATTRSRYSNIEKIQKNYEREMAYYFRKHPGWSFEQLIRKYPYLIQYYRSATPEQIQHFQNLVLADPQRWADHYKSMPVDFQIKLIQSDIDNLQYIPEVAKETMIAAVNKYPFAIDETNRYNKHWQQDTDIQIAALNSFIDKNRKNPHLHEILMAFVKTQIKYGTPEFRSYFFDLKDLRNEIQKN